MSPLTIAFVTYLMLVVFVGWITSRQVDSQSEFLLGGQRIPGWAIAISERASGESAWLLLGLTGAALTVGLSEVWTVIGCVGGILFLWLFLGERFRRELGHYDALTVPEFLSQRFRDPGNTIRWISSAIIIFFFSFYVSAQMVGAGKVLVKSGLLSADWSMALGPVSLTAQQAGVLIGAVIVTGYTLLGGFRAVVWTDLAQGLIMILALVVLPIAGWIELTSGSGSSLTEALAAHGSDKTSLLKGLTGWAALSMILGNLAWGLGYMGQPHLLVRFMAFGSAEEVRPVRWLAASWTLLAYGGAFMVGLVGLALLTSAQYGADAEKILPTMATMLLPGWMAGIVVSGAIAAMMSTADSQLLVVTSSFSEDIAYRISRRPLSREKQVRLSRLVTVVLGGLACLMALSSSDTVYKMVSYAWSGLGASFGPAVLLMLVWRRFNRAGVIASLLTGSCSTILWKYIDGLDALISHRLVSWVLALMAAVIVTHLTSRQHEA